ncbi:hypothetical protein CGRA01v4_04448 [Colletotrichum graminicola]|uniref:Uncharacterized protein n=1 Tax=Colletotrichum graminicola (strain M1.001 / M2 / FGSC 10212) TaxID=645133 RepID=E3Q9J5_COLGM|nr:uncharacterized protein GLRG_01869 [Colletotrichum graminicola M1.001]EFQ27374.1 hypothetical protein GLRG_01869 [Colletotrichum graminicola M1.001]WDK13167.1 hypothetical protein CGRA01v4_04448 [Colletotrichum graminicola]
MKYSGEMYDVFDLKLNIFRHTCSKAGIEEHQLAPIFSIMLRAQAVTFYFSRVCGSSIRDFVEIVQPVRSHFEIQESTQTYLTE